MTDTKETFKQKSLKKETRTIFDDNEDRIKKLLPNILDIQTEEELDELIRIQLMTRCYRRT